MAALLVVLMIGVLVAGVFMATMEESHIATTSAARERALDAIESALAGAVAGWRDRSSQQIGIAGQELSTISGGPMTVTIAVTRVDSTLYSIVAAARTPSSWNSVTRRVGIMVSVHHRLEGPAVVEPIPVLWWSEFL